MKGTLCLWNSMCDTKKGSLLLRTGIPIKSQRGTIAWSDANVFGSRPIVHGTQNLLDNEENTLLPDTRSIRAIFEGRTMFQPTCCC